MSDTLKAAALNAAVQLAEFEADDKPHVKVRKVARIALTLLAELENEENAPLPMK